jgi:hypothetical protein
MRNGRVALLSFILAFAFFPVPVGAQTIAQRVAALEAEVARLEDARVRHTRRLRELEGNIVADDLAGTYRAAGIITDMDGNPASITMIAVSAVVTLNPDFTGSIQQTASAINLVEGSPWSSGTAVFPAQQTPLTWSYAGGLLNITDGTPDLSLSFSVGAGGRVLIFSGLSDDETADFIVATRLQ